MQLGLAIAGDRAQMRVVLVHVLARDHRGAGRGISAHALAAKLAISEQLLRHLISEAREEGMAIVGTPETGYFVAETPDELEQCCAFLRSRAMHSLRIESRLRNIPLPDLLGQLHLKT